MKTVAKTLLILVVLCLLADGLYRLCFWRHDRVEYSGPFVALVDKIDYTGADILYLGESSNHTYGLDDTDTAWISEMIARHYPTLQVQNMTHDASHGEVYYQLLRNLRPTTPVTTVVVTMNLRSFGPDWIYSTLETVLQKRLVMMQNRPPLVNRAVLAFKAYDIKSTPERYAQMRHYWEHHPLPGHPSITAWADSVNTDSLTIPGVFVKNYAFAIDTLRNPRVRDFDRIVRLAQQRGWNLVFNIPAEDVEWAESLVGPDLTHQMYHNAQLLQQYYTRKGVTVVNNVDAVPDSLFRDRDWTTEHYLQEGRKIIADNVAQALRQFQNADYHTN